MPPRRQVKDKDTAKKRVLANRYQVEKRLGSGNFGTAFLVTDLKSKDEANKLKVMKEIPVGDLQPDETVDAMHEAKLLSKLDHPNIVKFHDSFLDGEYFCIVTEYCEGGDLDVKINQYSKANKRLDETMIIGWIIQLLLAVQYMHSRRVLHRDLKTRVSARRVKGNIFLRNNIIKIGDFGISRILMGTTDMASTFTGTPYYMSPEVLKHEGYNSKSDVWSVGCILFELCALEHAFEGQHLMGVMYKIVEGHCPEIPKKYSSQLSDILKRILIKNPDERPSAGEVLKINYIATNMEKMKDTIVERRNAKDSTVIATKDTADIAKVLNAKYRLRELQDKEKQDKWKNLSPRERMRLRKQHKADEEYRKIQGAAQAQYFANHSRRTEIKSTLSASKAPPWSRATAEHTKLQSNIEAGFNNNLRPKTAPLQAFHIDEDDDDDDVVTSRTIVGRVPPSNDDDENENEETVKEDVTLKSPSRRFSAPDERPITPMKDTSIYKKEFSFKGGIPDDPHLAETYYSQYDDFEPSGDEEEEDVFSDDEYGELINCMENALAATDAGELGRTATINDDTVAGAFGPMARDIKVKNLRIECVKALGQVNFDKVYNYLKNARYGPSPAATAQDESRIHKGLMDLVENTSDCFVVDQLLFLEQQVKS